MREQVIGNREQGNSRPRKAPRPRFQHWERGPGGEGRYTLVLLATAWLLEPDQALLDSLAQLAGLADVAGEMTPASAALEYSRVVLQQTPPYASLFLDDEAMLNSAHAEQVEREYRRAGFEIRPEWRAGPADHLGLELHFLAHLLEARSGEADAFLQTHVLPWAPVCLLAIGRIETAALYPRLAACTLDLLLELAGR